MTRESALRFLDSRCALAGRGGTFRDWLVESLVELGPGGSGPAAAEAVWGTGLLVSLALVDEAFVGEAAEGAVAHREEVLDRLRASTDGGAEAAEELEAVDELVADLYRPLAEDAWHEVVAALVERG